VQTNSCTSLLKHDLFCLRAENLEVEELVNTDITSIEYATILERISSGVSTTLINS